MVILQRLGDRARAFCDARPEIFGGPETVIGPRIDGIVNDDYDYPTSSSEDIESATPPLTVPPPALSIRTNCSCQSGKHSTGTIRNGSSSSVDEEGPGLSLGNVTLLMTGELIGLATHSFPQVFEVLGVATGLAALACVVAVYWYTSMVCWRVCLRHPEARCVSDVGRIVFGPGAWARTGQWFTAGVWAVGVIVSCQLIPTPRSSFALC